MEEEINEVVEVTVDSGAGKSVWPRRKKGVRRNKIEGRRPKLAAANGTEIEVDGEAVLEFIRQGRKCRMKFLDSDVKKPLAAAGEIVEQGNSVVLSNKWGSYIENDATGEKIPLTKKNGVFVMRLEATEQGAKNPVRCNATAMEVDGVEEERAEVFIRQMKR